MSATILIIDDDPLQSQIVRDTLELAKFHTVVAQDGSEGLRLLYQHRPDLVILDVVMPTLDGWEVCRRIRELSTVPIIFITVKGSYEDRVRGLKLGADDYLVKPFMPAELQARVEAVLRRAKMTSSAERRVMRLGGGDLVIEPDSREVTLRGEPIALTPTEYRLLVFMAERAGRVLSASVLADALWQDADVNLDSVRWYIWRLRQKIESDSDHPQYILTERGLGYRVTE